MSNSTIKGTVPRESVQISDTNAFVNSFMPFYDWNSYLYTKAGNQGANYLIGVRLPSQNDVSHVKILAISSNGAHLYIYQVNLSTSTITLLKDFF